MTALTTGLPAVGRTADRSNALAGTGTLIRFILRRDRIRIPIWVLALTLGTLSTATSFPSLYPTAADRQARAALLHDNPAGVAFSGPGYGLHDYTFGAMMTNEMLGFIAILVALMSVLLLVRHTRTEEEAGRAELVRAAVVGRHAHLTAALVAVAGTNILLGLAMALALRASGVESLDWVGSFAFGAALAAVGLVFAGIAAVTVQVTEHARAAAGMAGTMIGVAFVLRAAGDIGAGSGSGTRVLSWLSPIGWAQATRAYVDERWWPLGLAVLVAAAATAGAYALSLRRDVGAGMLAQRRGAAGASAALVHPTGLAVRLQRGALLGWGFALLALGVVYGTVISAIQEFMAGNSAVRKAMAAQGSGSLTDSFLATIVGMIAMVSALYAVQATLRLRGEETAGRVEPVLTTGLPRARWVGSHLCVALAGGSAVLMVSALGLGASAALSGGDTAMLAAVLGGAAVRLPALWVSVGVAVALFGLVPRLSALAWVVPVYGLIVGLMGGLLQLPEWLSDLSPFANVPNLPGADLTWTPLIVLTAIAAALVALGLAGFRRRDVTMS